MQDDRVLFVDDDPAVRKAFTRSLRSQGFDVDVAAGLTEALQKVSEHDYAVIATDYRLKHTDGLTVADELRGHRPLSTYMLVTGHCDTNLALNAVNHHGFSFVVPKPWDSQELASYLRSGIASFWERSMQHRLQRSAMDNTRGIQEQKRQLKDALDRSEAQLAEMLLNAADVKGHETRAHCRRVAAYAEMIAKRMGLSGSILTSIRQGALLHDVGTIIVPDSTLCKDGPLSEQEWELMHQHPVVGARVLDGIDSLRGARAVVLQHHERYNGTGYPFALAGETICLGARIFAVADTLDAIFGGRPYRSAETLQTAAEQILNGAGTLFDPAVVEAFATIAHEDLLAVQEMHPDPVDAATPTLSRHVRSQSSTSALSYRTVRHPPRVQPQPTRQPAQQHARQ